MSKPSLEVIKTKILDADSPKIRCVKNGVYFTVPESLPRGRHKVPFESIVAAQRERVLIAVTELLASLGYRNFGVKEIAKRSGVSLQAFYACYKSKDECVFAGYNRFIQTLLTHMMTTPLQGTGRVTLVVNLIGAYLDTLQKDLVVAKAYQVEIDAMGIKAREQRRLSLSLFAKYIENAVLQSAPDKATPRHLNWTAYLGVVYAARQLASDALEEKVKPDLGALKKLMVVWLNDLFRLD